MSKSNTVYKELLRRINHAVYRPGEKLPGEITLAAELGVSRVTLRSALKQLTSEGVIESYGRSGNYVSMHVSGKRFLLLIGGSTEQLEIVAQYISSLLRQNLANAGHQLELLSVNQLNGVTPDEWNAMLLESSIAGVFLGASYTEADTEMLTLFNSTRVPIIKVLDGHAVPYRFPVVTGAADRCFMDGVRYLASLGHKRICTVFADNSTRGISLELYKEFLRCNGVDDEDSLILNVSCQETCAAARRQLLGPKPPTAFMCFCDARALRVYAAARELGMRIPAQLSVMGMSGYSERLFAMPKLSMANFRYDLICAEAVKLMLRSGEWFKSGMENINIEVPYTIEAHGSCAAPPGQLSASETLSASSGVIFPTSICWSGDE